MHLEPHYPMYQIGVNKIQSLASSKRAILYIFENNNNKMIIQEKGTN